VNTITLTNDADGLGGGSISTNASQFGAAGSTLTLRDGVTVTNLNASGTIQATNVPGQAPGTLRLWQTNGIRYTELTIPDNYFATNKIVLSIGSNTVAAAQVLKVHSTSISGGVNTITLTNDTGGSAGGGGTNFPPVVLGTGTALTNVTTGVGVRQSITLLTSSNQYLNFQTDALNGETVTVAVTNMGATNVQIILQTNQVTSVFYDPTVASNRNSFTVAANAVAVNTFVHSTNFGNNWILYNTLGKEMELQVAGLGLSLLTNSSKDTLTITNTQSASLGITIDGGGSAITTGTKGYIEVPYNCVIERVTMLADQSGSAVVDLWKTNYANYPPTVGATITASAKPTITTATKSQTSTLTGWVTNVTAGDIIGFNVDSASTITRLTLQLKVNR
jgi:hypothetical protein